eukprot:COSAG05_NODE_385_length_10486_cov_12.944835_3_plen_92_part_00
MHAPHKALLLPGLMATWQGREALLLRKIEAKYLEGCEDEGPDASMRPRQGEAAHREPWRGLGCVMRVCCAVHRRCLRVHKCSHRLWQSIES